MNEIDYQKQIKGDQNFEDIPFEDDSNSYSGGDPLWGILGTIGMLIIVGGLGPLFLYSVIQLFSALFN